MHDSDDQKRSRHVAVAAAIFLAFFKYIFSNNAIAQEELERTLPSIVIDTLKSTYKIDYIAPNIIFSSYHYKALDEILPLPNDFQNSVSYSKYLLAFQRVPQADLSLSKANDDAVIDRLLKLENDVEFSSKKLSQDEVANLASAKELLYLSNESRPSPDYSQYLDFQRRYMEGLEKLNKETNPASIAVIKAEIQRTEKNWEIFGKKREIESALNTLKQNESANTKIIYSDFLQIIEKEKKFVASSIDSALYASDWSRIGFSGTQLSDINLNLEADGKNTPLPALSRVSLDATLVPIRFAPLFHAFFESRYWRTISGYSVSDGIEDRDGSELVPRFISHLFLIKNFELTFSDRLPDAAIKTLSSAKSITLATIKLKSAPTTGIVFQDRMISVAPSMIVGFVVADLAKIPDTAAGNEWDQ